MNASDVTAHGSQRENDVLFARGILGSEKFFTEVRLCVFVCTVPTEMQICMITQVSTDEVSAFKVGLNQALQAMGPCVSSHTKREKVKKTMT